MQKFGKQRKLQKKEEAQKRNEKRKTRSAKEQIHILDVRFGENQGAKKERHRLVDEIEKAYANAAKKSPKKRPKPKHNH